MKKVVFLCFLVVSVFGASAQGVENKMRTTASASQIYLEVLGSGVIYSLNFDSRFGKKENGLGFRVGIGGAGGGGYGYFTVPAQINYLLGENGKYLELGGGMTYVHTRNENLLFNDQSKAYGNLVIGFRSQPFGRKGITWRVAFTPFVTGDGFQPFGGAGVGFRF